MEEVREDLGGRLISLKEIQRHKSVKDCWVTVDGEVYDVTSFIKDHPSRRIVMSCGGDATDL